MLETMNIHTLRRLRMHQLITPCACVVAMSIGTANADMVYFENNGAIEYMGFFDPNLGNTIIGHSLDITAGVYEQPAFGATPVASIFFMNLSDFDGQFIWMGTGAVTRTVQSGSATLIPTTELPDGATYFGPEQFSEGSVVDSDANFVEGWRLIHGINNLTGAPGVFSVEELFTVGIEFERSGQLHYGFAEFEVSYEALGADVDVTILPVRWGYNDTAGESAFVVPAPASSLALIGLGIGVTRRRR